VFVVAFGVELSLSAFLQCMLSRTFYRTLVFVLFYDKFVEEPSAGGVVVEVHG